MLSHDDIIAHASRLPAPPQALSEALEEMNRPDVDIAHVGSLLARDQGIVLRVLRIANSSFYGLSRRVAALPEAIHVVGLPAVRSLLIAYAVAGRFPSRGKADFDYVGLWRHSLLAAAAARDLAPRVGANREMAFLAGLLHDVGKALLGCCAPGDYQAAVDYARDHGCTALEAEQATLGLTHAQIGAILAEQWRFPSVILAAIHDHHAPGSGGEPVAHLVHAADVVACGLDGHLPIGEIASRISAETRRMLGLEESGMAELLDRIESQAAGLMGMLEVEHR